VVAVTIAGTGTGTGTGSAVPDHIVTTETIGSLVERHVPGKGAEWAERKLGIKARRFMAPLDPTTGFPIGECNELALAQDAALKAMKAAKLNAHEIGGLWYVSCTQPDSRRHFSRSVLDLHHRLGLRSEAIALEMDAGCGGAVHALSAARGLLIGGMADNALIVAVNGTSQHFGYWETYARSGAWLSLYIFGDGAGAAILQRQKSHAPERGILASYAAVDPTIPLMDYIRPYNDAGEVYRIDGRGVALSFRRYARAGLEGLREKYPFRFHEVRRFYFHQVNANVLRNFVEEMEIPQERVSLHVERYGNLAAASTLVLLDEDIRAGIVGPGDLCVVCAVGAGAQYGAMLVRL
jgi:3-oxoacyl-[acyl-carrier-protein] synthase III